MTTFNSPNLYILELLKNLKNLNDWKIVIISQNNNIDKQWKLLEFESQLIYLSINKQRYLGYNIIKYIKNSFYSKRNIGYLYAIEHGAKEIYDIDEDNIIYDLNHLNECFNNTFFSYGLRNDSKMINPFHYFGEANIWPRGFRIKDIGNNDDNKYYILNSNQLKIKPLIFQGLINEFPDVDSIFIQTRIKKNNLINLNFSYNYPLLYLPGNYIPINAKNTKYLYNIFPYLFIPISLNERISDIFRGYIMQFFAWINKGAIIYYFTSIYQNKFNDTKKKNIFFEEKDLFYKLDNLLNELNEYNIIKNIKNMDNINLYLDFIKILVGKGYLKKVDLSLYKSFIKDLIKIKYNFTFQLPENYEYQNNFHIYSRFKYYLPYNLKINLYNNIKGKIKIFNHYISNKIYKDILLIINYNHGELHYLNKYLINLYNTFFPNIVFIIPNKSIQNNESNIISCEDSFNGYYSYICFKKIYKKFPNYKGYLFINDDLFIKFWEFDNLDFNIPWIYLFSPNHKNWDHYFNCLKIHKIISRNIYWKRNLIDFLSFYYIPTSLADFYYIPNFLVKKFIDIIEKMFDSKIFLECAVPTAMGIMLYNKYQLIKINPLWERERDNVINYLKNNYKEITIHPIKFSNKYLQEAVNKYIFFINAKEF